MSKCFNSHQLEFHSATMNDATQILNSLSDDPGAAELLAPLVYEELRKLAAARMARESPGQTLQATALVHEAYLRLVDPSQCVNEWQSRGHFFKAAATAMRRILIERARKKKSLKHGGDYQRESMEALEISNDAQEDRLLEMDEALNGLAQRDPRKAEVVNLRFFVGLSNLETAEALGLSLATVERDWAFAKAWLYRHLS
jgi:RNA polymerase sigma factor (TIGR02999 family)